jgi:4-amino-4-deoxy-L-arabinose transferase-like glycosyltransferase
MADLTRAGLGPVTGAIATRRAVVMRISGIAALAGICALAAVLRLTNFAAVPTTPFYDAAVRSMALSWHNFFYGALDPAGQLAVDKPPLDLWLQVASIKLLGFSSVALRLPPAIAGVVAVPLLYDLVRRGQGRWAGLAAGLAFAVLPATVLTSRSDTMDTVMAALLVLAAWLVVRATPERRGRAVVAAGAVAGLAFEVKLTEAMVALPALALLAWLALDGPTMPKWRTLGLAGAAFLAAAAAWPVIASLLPGHHPFAYGSSDGSIWKDILIYNGVSRLGNPPTAATTPGLHRLFDPAAPRHFGQLIGAELLCALAVGALAAGFARGGRHDVSPDDDHRRLRHAVSWSIGAWLLLGFLVASSMGRQWPRYLEAFTPAVAGVLGAGIVALARAAVHRSRAMAALSVGAVVAALAGRLTGGSTSATVAAAAVAAAAVLAIGAAALVPSWRKALVGVGATLVLAASLAVPVATSVRVVRAGSGDGEPTGALPAGELARLSAYLRAHQGNARYEAAGAQIFSTAALIVKDARPVQTLMNVGNRPLLTAAQLERESRGGIVRYVVIGQPKCVRQGIATCPPVLRWARAHGTDVSLEAGLPHRGILYRLPAATP